VVLGKRFRERKLNRESLDPSLHVHLDWKCNGNDVFGLLSDLYPNLACWRTPEFQTLFDDMALDHGEECIPALAAYLQPHGLELWNINDWGDNYRLAIVRTSDVERFTQFWSLEGNEEDFGSFELERIAPIPFVSELNDHGRRPSRINLIEDEFFHQSYGGIWFVDGVDQSLVDAMDTGESVLVDFTSWPPQTVSSELSEATSSELQSALFEDESSEWDLPSNLYGEPCRFDEDTVIYFSEREVENLAARSTERRLTLNLLNVRSGSRRWVNLDEFVTKSRRNLAFGRNQPSNYVPYNDVGGNVSISRGHDDWWILGHQTNLTGKTDPAWIFNTNTNECFRLTPQDFPRQQPDIRYLPSLGRYVANESCKLSLLIDFDKWLPSRAIFFLEWNDG
jgi:hypothetical protein